jgi:predicted phage replisome organizer
MADNKKYYYLKLKENFYDSEEMILLQNMQDGYLYSDILMKLYLRSLKNNGKLMFKDVIPYTPSALAQVVRHQVGTVEKALKLFQELGLVEILDNGAIYMMDIQNFIGESSTEADRKRVYRDKIKNEKLLLGQKSDICPDKSTPEIEIDIDIEKDIDIDIKKKKEKVKHKYGEYKNVFFTDEQYSKLITEFPNDYNERIENLDSYIQSTGKKYKDCLATIRNWARKDKKKPISKNTNNNSSIEEDTEEMRIIREELAKMNK